MKRGFLFGLGSFLILGAIAGVLQFISAHELTSIVLAFVLIPLSVITIRTAGKAPPNRSTLHDVFGWLIGFFVIDAVILGIVGIVMALR